MTKIVGLMCVRDEADLLPEVVPHVRNLVDELYFYDDNSQDNTWKFSKEADYAIHRQDDLDRPNIKRPGYHHLLEEVKKRYDVSKEDVWAAITMGDRFFLNKTPRQLVEEAGNYNSVQGVQLDFLRHRLDPWTEDNDTFPYYFESLRNTCRWAKVDEHCIVVFKVTEKTSYLKAKYPWPRGIEGRAQYSAKEIGKHFTEEMPFLEHQGRRSPKACMWRYSSGSRKIGRKHKNLDLSTFDAVMRSYARWYAPYRVFPWTGPETISEIVHWENSSDLRENRANLRWFFWGLEALQSYYKIPPRTDI